MIFKTPNEAPNIVSCLIKAVQNSQEEVHQVAQRALAQVARCVPKMALNIIEELDQIITGEYEELFVRPVAIEALVQVAQAAPSNIPDIIPSLQKAVQGKEIKILIAGINAFR